MSIPKVIHYCWFGRGEKSEIIEHCMESWKKFCPDWEIIEWNEDNFDPCFCPYAANAYKKKKYAFLSDVARLKIIYEHGGIYLDTDAELIAPIDELLENDAWFAYAMTDKIGTGIGFGAVENNWMVKALLDNYLSFGKFKRFSKFRSYDYCTTIDTKVFKRIYDGFAEDRSIEQFYNGVHIINNISDYTIHHYTNTWMNKRQRLQVALKKKLKMI